MDRSFFLVLPSNGSKDTYPDNEIGNYTISLAQPIHLEGQWEVALAEIFYTHSWNDVDQSQARFWVLNHLKVDEGATLLKVPTGHYEDINILTQEINTELKTADIDLEFKFDSVKKRISVRGSNSYSVRFEGALAHILGYESNVWSGIVDGSWAPYPSDPFGAQYSFYLYSNIIEMQHVGEFMVPLLRIVQKRGVYGENISISYDRLHYVSVNKSVLRDIQIEIKTDLNTPVRFTYGKTVCKLHFRPVIS